MYIIYLYYGKSGNFSVIKYFQMAYWYPKIKSTKIFYSEYTIPFVVPPSLAPHVNNNRSLLFSLRMARRYLKLFVHGKYGSGCTKPA